MMNIVLVGNFTLDKIWVNNEYLGEKLGGGIYYSLLPIIERGINIEIHCVFNPFLYSAKELWSKNIHLSKAQFSTHITTFTLIYSHGSRELYVEDIAPPIMSNQFSYYEAIYILNPVMNEITTDLIKTIRSMAILVSSDIQGYIREVDKNRKVTYRAPLNIDEIFNNIDILHVHIDEARAITGKNIIEDIIYWFNKKAKKTHIILTQDSNPVYIISKDLIKIIEFDPIKVEDTTGAGDYLLSVITLYYMRSNDIVYSVEKAIDEVRNWLIKRNTSSRPTTPEPPPPNP